MKTETALRPPKDAARSSGKHCVLLVDDHVILRQGLAQIINQEPDLFVCAEAADSSQAFEAIERLKPDVVLLDISLPGMNGIEFLKNLRARYPDLPAVVLSMHDESLYAERALRAGALGYVRKRESSEEVLAAIRSALKGEYHVTSKVGGSLFRKFLGKRLEDPSSPVSALSDRELEVFELIGRGRRRSDIANELHVSLKTVDSHREHIKEKLGLSNAAEMTKFAVQWVEEELRAPR
jgi:DNA-binding NarL/FixJ family response regulator